MLPIWCFKGGVGAADLNVHSMGTHRSRVRVTRDALLTALTTHAWAHAVSCAASLLTSHARKGQRSAVTCEISGQPAHRPPSTCDGPLCRMPC